MAVSDTLKRESAMRADVSLITREPDAKRSSITRTMFTGGPFRICFYGWQPSLGYSGERRGHYLGHLRESAVKQHSAQEREDCKGTHGYWRQSTSSRNKRSDQTKDY